MIEACDLRKSYGSTVALAGVSFRIERGEIVGLLGPNGAGKTTTMKILTGYLLPDGGTARVAGHDVIAEPLEVQARIGYLPENAPLYPDMLAGEYLGFMARMRGLDPGGADADRLLRAARECGISEVLGRPIGQLSKGYRQRVGLAGTILHDPEILILDEPTSGLDPNQIVEVRELIRRMGRDKTVILSTHILPEVEATCGRAVIVIDGHVRADGALDELTRGQVQVVTCGAPDAEAGRAALADLVDGATIEAAPAGDGLWTFRFAVTDRDGALAERIAARIHDRGWSLRELRRDDRTLEQVFRELTETAFAAGEGAR
ncbi:MAG: ATP-binding cassette domain-containing protein [Acidobacteriota bacterium]|nr:MAG: ATP-binding cassette domain-containing protein [Acidobacteriota bacterium]